MNKGRKVTSIAFTALLFAGAISLSGCNTVAGAAGGTLQGVGQDLSAIGGAVAGGFRGAYDGAVVGARTQRAAPPRRARYSYQTRYRNRDCGYWC